MSLIYKIYEAGIKAAKVSPKRELQDDKFLAYIESKHRAEDIPKFLYKKFNVIKTNLDGRWVFKIQPKNSQTDKVILFLHGGGGMMCPTYLHYKMAERLVKNTGAVMYFPFYPLAPEATVLDTMAWVKKLYEMILEQHRPENITFIGDSAGAFLAARLCSLTPHKPNGVVMISPAIGMDKYDSAMQEAEKNDILLSKSLVDMFAKYWGKGVALDSPDIDPEYIDYSNFPPVLLYYGTNEMFYPNMHALISNIRKYGVRLEVHEGKAYAMIGQSQDLSRKVAEPYGKFVILQLMKIRIFKNNKFF